LATALIRGIQEILRRLLKRRLRSNPRVVKRKMSNYNAKRSNHRAWPQPTQPPDEAITIATPST
jgi:hypothetical protein